MLMDSSKGNFVCSSTSVRSSKSDSNPSQANPIEFSSGVTPPVSVRIIDADEKILFSDSYSLGRQLGCPPDLQLKSLVIVGNTGDGKSHTLNHAFCGNQEVFVTSASQTTCTLGVWVAYEPQNGYLIFDTEGLLGASANPNRQRRLLLKVLALADVVIYRTMSDRLHSDMFTFLADASDAFAEHFRPELENLALRSNLPWSASQLGPAIVIFQETHHTEPLFTAGDKRNENERSTFLKERFLKISRNADAFSTIRYVGIRTTKQPTNFKSLVAEVDSLMRDTTVRSPRRLSHIITVLYSLNDHFACELPSFDAVTFVQEYFTCPAKCISCQTRCRLGVNHNLAKVPHESRNELGDCCQYNPSIQNKVYYCKACYANGKSLLLIPKFTELLDNPLTGVVKYLWAGYVLECPIHGTVYRSRAHWSGNVSPENTSKVQWQVVHVWPGEKSLLQGAHPVGQLVIDGLSSVTNQVAQLTGSSTRLLSELIADSVAPTYWQANSEIKRCACCNFEFLNFSDSLASSTNSLLQISTQDNVAGCKKQLSDDQTIASPAVDVNKLKLADQTPHVSPSDDAAKHHCRSCGRGVCASCSKHRIPIPERGFGTEPVRVCFRCYEARIATHSNQTEKLGTMQTSSAYRTNKQINGADKKYTPNTSGRKVIELLSATAGYIKPVFNTPKEIVKSLARPEYWQPNEECVKCKVCSIPFGLRTPIHHCRDCGFGVCSTCSQKRMPIPKRGLDWPSRVCNECFNTFTGLNAPLTFDLPPVKTTTQVTKKNRPIPSRPTHHSYSSDTLPR